MQLQSHIGDPPKRWKLSSMDLESRRHWETYTRAREVTLERLHIPKSSWQVVLADGKKCARLNCIHHFLGQTPYHPVPHLSVLLPEHIHHAEYIRHLVPEEMTVPNVY